MWWQAWLTTAKKDPVGAAACGGGSLTLVTEEPWRKEPLATMDVRSGPIGLGYCLERHQGLVQEVQT